MVYNIGVKRPAQRGVILIIKIQSEISLASTCFARYRGITSNGCWIFLTRQGTQEVVKLDSYFRVAECFPTCRCYASLCYDPCMITHKIEQIDAGAFINVMKTEKVLGNYYQQPLE